MELRAVLLIAKTVVEGSLDQLGRETLAGGNYRIEVETTQPSPQLIETINKVKGVNGVQSKDNILVISADSDLRAEIAKVVVQSNIPLIQMNIQKFSLDDIYMKYFKEG